MKKSIKKLLASVVAGAMAFASVLVATPVVANAADDTLQVYVKAPEGWENVSIHTWNVATPTGDWPGATMTACAENAGYYEYELVGVSANTGIIFNNAGAGLQTEDITGVTAGTCWYTLTAPAEAGGKYTATASSTAPAGWVTPGEKTPVQKTIEKIDAIGEVTLGSLAAIDAAEAAYDALGETEKSQVTNYETLTKARADYNALKEAQDKANEEAAGELTVYVKAPEGWATVSMWAWTDNGDLFKEWPGQTMAVCENNAGYCKATIPVDGLTSIIFNDSATNNLQTEDIKGVAAGTYWYTLTAPAEEGGKYTAEAVTTAPAGWVDEEKAELETETTTEATEDGEEETETEAEAEEDSSWDDTLMKVHFLNSEEWEKVGIYLTYGSWAAITGDWPGVEMQLEVGSETWYAYGTNGTDEETYNVIFNNMVSNEEAAAGGVKHQTPDTTGLEAGEYWFVLADKGTLNEKGDQVTYEVAMFDSVEALEEAGYTYDGEGLDSFEEPAEDEEPVEDDADAEDDDKAEADKNNTGDVAPIAVVLLGLAAVGAVVASKKRQNA